MAKRKPSTEWREFEKLVARIEADAGPAGMIVKSPDHIKSKLTGKSREVDASVRMRVGTSEMLITIECRKRKHRQDVTWIEQLATKKQVIGAAKTIAVSSSDFSAQAHEVARHLGIDLRKLSEVTVADLNSLVKIDYVHFKHRRCLLVDVGFRSFRGANWTIPNSNEVDWWLDKIDLHRLIFNNSGTGARWSLNDLWLQLQKMVDPFQGILVGAKPTIRTACFPYFGDVEVETVSGKICLGDVLLNVAVSIEIEIVSLDSAKKVEYCDDQGNVLQRVEFESKECNTGDLSVALQLPKDATDVKDLRTRLTTPKKSKCD